MAPEISHFSYAECFSAHHRVNEACGRSRRESEKEPGYYTLRMMEALQDPAKASPRLSRALKLFACLQVDQWAEDGTQKPSGYDALAIRLRAIVDAIDDDDEAEQQAVSRAEAEAKSHAALVEAVLRPAQPKEECPIPPEALSLDDAARFAGLRRTSIEHLIETRQLAYVQVGAQRVRAVRVEDLRAFMLSRRQPTGEEARRRSGRSRGSR